MAWGIRLSVYLFLVYQFTVSALPASRNFTTVKLIPPRSQAQDASQGQVAQRTDIGVKADQKSAFLGNKADAFRLHRPGFEHVPGSVSLESGNRPGLYLRYKNYRFHLEKMKPSGVFEKDATFIERKTQTRGAAAYELFNHPGWFMCHDTNSPFGLVAQKTEIKSHEFLTGCLYMAVAQRPTKQDIQERLKLDTVLKNENSGVTKGFVRNFSGIITNDVSAANLPKADQNGKAMINSLNSQNQTSQSKTHDQKDVEKSMNNTSQMQKTQAMQSSNATVSGASSLVKLTDDKSLNKSVKFAADKASGFNVTKQLDDTKNAHAANVTKVAKPFHDTGNTNVTKHFHDTENAQVANGTQDAQKPKINLQNNLNILAVHEGKQLLHNDKKKAQDLAGNLLGNQSNSASGGAKGKNPSFSQQQTGLHSKVANNSLAVESLKNNSHGTFVSAKESAQPGLQLAQSQKVLNHASLQKNNNANGKGFSQMKASSGKGPALQQDKNGIGFGVSAPGKNIKDKAAKGFTMHLNFPNGNPHQMNQSNQAASFTFQQNATLPAGHGPHSVQNNILQITAKTLGFLHSALQHHQQNGAPQFAKDRPVPPFQQQQRQQHRFQRPMSYFGQQRRPQQMFRGPGNKFAPAPFGSRGPLPNAFAASIGARRPQAPYAFKQFKGVGAQPQTSKAFGYKNPWNTWKGMVSVGKQSLMGNSAKPVHDQVNSTKPQGNNVNQTSEQKDKCISLKFLNKIRKPIKLVSSMKPEGYLITAETFKLRTIFKHPRKHHHVIFYARDANDRDNEVMLNNNNAIAVTPGGCDLPFRSVLLSHHGQIANKEIERLREEDEYNASIDAARKSVNGGEKENFNQWTSFSSCSASCGRSLQTRSRSCKAGKVCTGKAVEIRTCIQTPCPVTTCVKTYSGKCCALPFVYRGAVVNRCLVDPQTRRSWCATTPNYDKEKRWGFCQPAGPHTEKVAAVIRSFLPGPPSQFQLRSAPCPKECGKVCMAWCPRNCCAANSIS